MSISDGFINVYCDRCSRAEPFMMTALAGGGYDARNITESFLQRHGWVAKDGQHFCEDCVEAVT